MTPARLPSARLPPLQGDPTVVSGVNGTLYLGKLPSKPAEGYVGVLPSRPPATPRGTALVGLQLGTQQPLFSLVVAGDSVYAASGSLALLQVGPGGGGGGAGRGGAHGGKQAPLPSCCTALGTQL